MDRRDFLKSGVQAAAVGTAAALPAHAPFWPAARLPVPFPPPKRRPF